MIAIYKKEIKNYFKSLTGYVFLFFFVLVTAAFYFSYNVLMQDGDYTYALSASTIVFLIMIPLITMRLFAEEAAQKTDQLLYTSALPISGVVVGKFLAALSLFVIAMAITVVFPFMLSLYGEIPVNQIASAYLGYILLGMCFISVGVFVAVLTNNQIVAAAGTFAVIFFLYILDGFISALPADRTSSLIFVITFALVIAYLLYDSTKSIPSGIITLAVLLGLIGPIYFLRPMVYDGLLVKAVTWVSLMSRFNNFYAGVLSLSDVAYYITFSIAFNFFTVTVIEKRRWR